MINIYDSLTADKEIAYSADGSRSLRGDAKSLQMCKVEPQFVEFEHDVDVGGNAGNVQAQPSYPTVPAIARCCDDVAKETSFATVPVISRCCDDVVRETRFELPGSWKGISYVLVEYCSPRDSPLRCETQFTKAGYLVRMH